MERKKLAWRAAGAGKWTGYEGVAAERAAVSADWRRSVVKRRGAVVLKRRDMKAWRHFGGAIYL